MRFEWRQTSDGSDTVFDHEAGECFKSRHAARLEAEHVFYRPAVAESPLHGGARPFRVLELGLGLGTNFLHFLARGFEGEFVSIERDLSGARFYLAGKPESALAQLVEQGSFEEGGMRATLLQGDFFDRLPELRERGLAFHAILFDPFSPKANPDCWTEELFQHAAALLVPGGRLVTYSVSRAAKDASLAAGLRVSKRELPPELRKRAALLAEKPLLG